MKFSGIHLRGISQWVPWPLFRFTRLKLSLLQLLPYLPGPNELSLLIYSDVSMVWVFIGLSFDVSSHYLNPSCRVSIGTETRHTNDHQIYKMEGIFLSLFMFKRIFFMSWVWNDPCENICSIAIPIEEIRWSYDHLISTIGFPILMYTGKTSLHWIRAQVISNIFIDCAE